MSSVLRARRALVGPVVTCTLGLLAPQGCGGPDRPSAFGDVAPTARAPADNAPPPLIDIDGAANVPTCNLGPQGGVCACADQPLLIDTPNLYFVLDRSGSMSEANKWGNVQAALKTLVVSLGPRANFGAAVFPNPLENGCMPGAEVFAPRPGDAPAGTPGRTDAALAAALARIPAAGGTPTAATLAALLPKLKALPGKTYVILATDGGPNCGMASCTPAGCTANIDGVAGCPPNGAPNCCLDAVHGGAQSCLDAQPTLTAIAAIASAGIPVYVIGVPGSAPYASLLDQMAQAGMTARAAEPYYYAIGTADQAALQSVLASIAAKITGTCTLDLGSLPPDPGLVNVFFDERPLPQAGPDGWTLDGTTVTIGGASCQKILDGGVLDVRVVAGCPTVTF